MIVSDQAPDLIDLTDEAFEDTDVPRHYINWLTDLIERAKIKPTTVEQRLEEVTVSSDVIVIDDASENTETNNKVNYLKNVKNLVFVVLGCLILTVFFSPYFCHCTKHRSHHLVMR